ncbi:DNA helicase rad5 [Borealophlyctis nickersoniae]|nr:DNA helicase rad5 [Borealophlyctis nickersoniae]
MMDDIIVSLSVFMTKSSFQTRSRTYATPKSKTTTSPDDRVKDTKLALTSLFDRLGLKPTNNAPTADVNLDNDNSNTEDATAEAVTAMDLGVIYRKANQLDKSVGKAQPRDGMVVTLREYQATGLGFMLWKENAAAEAKRANGVGSMSPLWHEVGRRLLLVSLYILPSGDVFYFNPYSGELSLDFPTEEHTCGGILADEMGLGKTIEILSLIHTNRRTETPRQKSSAFSAIMGGGSGSDKFKGPTPINSTLIVCPLNVLGQWRNEINRCFDPGEVSVEMYYGNERTKRNRNLFVRPDAGLIVLTTYGTLASEFGDGSEVEESPLYNVAWFRVVLDEAHYIKERSTKVSKACCALIADKRWAVTGTPIVNSLEDLYSLVHFLKVEPWSHWSFWHAFISVPFAKKDPRALEIVQTVLEPVILRRTKDLKDADGNPIVELPPKRIEIKYLEFSQEERDIYDSLTNYSKRRLSDLKSIGKADYAHVFRLILRLRQACDHPLLLKSASSSDDEPEPTFIGLQELVSNYCGSGGGGEAGVEFTQSLIQELEGDEEKECPVCLDACADPVVLPCLHVVCCACMEDFLRKKVGCGEEGECPVCRTKCSERDLLRVIKQTGGGGDANGAGADVNGENGKRKPSIALRSASFKASAKLRALIETLKDVRSGHPGVKTVVFSQWTSMLNLVEIVLKEHEFGFVRLDGTLTQKAREAVLERFADDDDTTVLIASLRSSGVGINLTMASRVVMVDPWWNESVETQAIDRVHRLGQTLPVEVTRFIIAGSVEEKMLTIQTRKSELAGAVTSPEDKKLRLEDLMALFDD